MCNNATVGLLAVSAASLSGNVEAFRIDAGSTVTRMSLTNVSLGTSGTLVRNRAATATEIVIAGVVCGNTFVGLDTAGGSASVRGSGFVQTSGAHTTPIYRSGTQVVRSRSADFARDVSALAKNVGDMALNLNAGLSCGLGPVICKGTIWTNIATGATY